jgi:predicted transcriptional regulator
MNASEIMVDKVITLNSEETVAKALKMMHENDINQIPIVDDNQKTFLISLNNSKLFIFGNFYINKRQII